MMSLPVIYIITLQHKNYYDNRDGDELKLLGQDISYLLASRILKVIDHESKIAIFAPKLTYQNFLANPLPSNILLVERDNLSFSECISFIASHDFSKGSEDFIWLNSRFLNFDFQEIFQAHKYKTESDLDLVFSSDAHATMIADDNSFILNLIANKVDTKTTSLIDQT